MTAAAGARRPLWGWLLADAISLIGTRVSLLAIPWFVLTTTGSATRTGLVSFAELAPMVLVKVLGGPLIDRLGARRVAVACDLASFVVVGTIPLLHVAELLHFGTLLALVALAGALRGPGDSAKDSLTPAIVAHAGVSMERATGLSSAVERSAGLVGFALAGALVAAIGPANALAVDAVSFLVGGCVLAWATLGLGRREVAAATGSSPGGTADAAADGAAGTAVGSAARGGSTGATSASYVQQFAEGWRFLRHEPVLLSLSLMIAVTNLLDMAWSAVLAPVWARESGQGVGVLGAVFATFAGCSALGALVAARWAERMPRFAVYVAAFLLTGLPRFLVFAWEAPLSVVIAVMVVAGFASGFLNPILGAVFFDGIPETHVGRVSSLSTALCFALMPLGGLLGGVLIAHVGLSAALLAVGVAYLAATLAPAVIPSFRAMERPTSRGDTRTEPLAEPARPA